MLGFTQIRGMYMSKVYIISPDGQTVIGLDCEKNITVSRSNKVTTKSVMSGKDISDGYQAGLRTVNINGMMTYSKSVAQQDTLNPLDFQREIDNLVDGRQRFTLYSEKSIQLLDDIADCVIESCTVMLDKFLNAIQVDLVIREVWISQAAQVGNLYLPPEKSSSATKDGSDPTKGKGGKSEVEVKETKTILAGTRGLIFDTVGIEQ
ncbi:hypothetical protein VPBG_00054 [Vibrio phage helene 12B3]|uniref:endolysin n=1 Tax=Vibrio phage helene 12B3 TaxID=573173 RepID=UPI0002C0DAEF|nr:endolysin [Vibrio phage helene 12B3]AGG57826.1 hypothetical protein VPBG_00054 [Vibrio phage helene 12B3]